MVTHPRYTRAEMAHIWSEENRFSQMLRVEIAAAQAMAEEGIIPIAAAKEIARKAHFSIERIQEIEKTTRHETIAFLSAVSENLGDSARYLHQGMTSSDVLDTGFSLQLTATADVLKDDLEKLLQSLKKRIEQHRHTPCIGRSHGIHAEPMTFGLKLAGHYAAFKRHLQRLESARKEIAICAISGPVGTFSLLAPTIEKKVAEALGLNVETVSTQVIPRDRHAFFFSVLAGIAGSIENLATEIRHLQRSEVREVEELFGKGQKGSSAMPHKKNPILSENLTGLARIVRSSVIPALENVTLWHERDMSHSSVERFIAPQATATLDFALVRLAAIVENLVVHDKRMIENIHALKGLVFSQPVLLAMTAWGMAREDAYAIVQRSAMKVWDGEGDFLTVLIKAPEMPLNENDLEAIFDLEKVLRHTDEIIDRALTG